MKRLYIRNSNLNSPNALKITPPAGATRPSDGEEHDVDSLFTRSAYDSVLLTKFGLMRFCAEPEGEEEPAAAVAEAAGEEKELNLRLNGDKDRPRPEAAPPPRKEEEEKESR